MTASSSTSPSGPSPRPTIANRAIIGIRVAQDAEIELPRRGRHRPRRRGRRLGRPPVRARRLQELGTDVDRGLRVAATGEIELDGSVSAVGGIKQKTRRRPALGRRRLPRPGWGKREHVHAAMQGTFASSRWRIFNRRCALWQHFLRNSVFAGILPRRGRHPQIAGDFVERGLHDAWATDTMAAVLRGISATISGDRGDDLSKRSRATCNDCYFRQAGLCALPGDTTCPTFRAATVGRLEPPRQPRLVLRPPAVVHAAPIAHASA